MCATQTCHVSGASHIHSTVLALTSIQVPESTCVHANRTPRICHMCRVVQHYVYLVLHVCNPTEPLFKKNIHSSQKTRSFLHASTRKHTRPFVSYIKHMTHVSPCPMVLIASTTCHQMILIMFR